jgi:serine/threonine protein kinase
VNGQLLSGRYQVIDRLGNGGFAQTYLAEDIQRPNRPQCVVKKLKLNSQDPKFIPTARRLFQQEAEILEKLGTHSQIPQLLAYFEEKGEFFLVQEYINGYSIAREIREKCWQESEIIQFIEELLNLLIFVHSHNVIHRDIKPDNLIRRKQDGKLVLIDFGAVKEISKQTETIIGTIKTTIGIGTIGYMPPEQIIGKPRPCSDIYAIGITAIQALTGLNSQQLNYDDDGEVIWLPHAKVSQGLADFLNKTVSYYIKDRYQTAVEALTALQQVLPAPKLIHSYAISSELNILKTIVPVNTIDLNNILYLNSQELNIPKTIVSSNIVNNSLPSLNSIYRKKPAWLGIGLVAILASSLTVIIVKSWSDRSSIVVESKPSLSTQSTPTTPLESNPISTPTVSSKSNSNNTSETIAPKIDPDNAVKHYYDMQTNSGKVSIKPQEKQIQTTSIQKSEEPRKTTTITNKTGGASQTNTTNNKTEAPKKTTTTTNKTEAPKKTATTTNKTKGGSQTTKRNDRTKRRNPTTTTTNKTKNRSQTTKRNDRTERRNPTTTRNNRTQGQDKTSKRKEKRE